MLKKTVLVCAVAFVAGMVGVVKLLDQEIQPDLIDASD